MIGWIALYRSITDHWIWNTSSKRFQRWVDLLFLASWKERDAGFGNTVVHLKRGQIVTSVRQLMGRWRTNNTTVTDTLKRFEDNGMIICNRGRKMTIITIVNYNKYQRFASLAQSLADEQRNGDVYPPESDVFVFPIEADERRLRVQNQIPIEQDNNIIINKTLRSDAHTHEEIFESFFESQITVEAFCMEEGIDIDTCKKLAREVINDWNLTGKTHENDTDAKEHLLNRLRKKIAILQKQNKNNNGRSTGNDKEVDNASSGEPNPLSRARVYKAETNS